MILIEENVHKVIDEYTQYIINEGLTSKQRGNQKREGIIKTINKNLGGLVSHRLSPYKQLGRDEGCRLYVYTDPKSKTQWGFGYKDFGDNNVIVYYMRNMKLVTENNEVKNLE